MGGQVHSTTIRKVRPQKNYSGFRYRAGAGVSIGRVRTAAGAADYATIDGVSEARRDVCEAEYKSEIGEGVRKTSSARRQKLGA